MIHFYGDPSYSPIEHTNKKSKQIPYIYFHGNLQDMLNFDLVFSETKESELPLGKYDCIVGNDLKCKAFIYKNDTMLRGLIVLSDDTNAIEQAEEAYHFKLRFL